MSRIVFGKRTTPSLADVTDTDVYGFTSQFNRHGLISGATGTGKTVTLRTIVEQLSEQGVPVFLADLKGDLADLERTCPVRRLSLTGNVGESLSIPVEAFGSHLWSKMLDATPVQESVLDAILGWCEENGHRLDNIDDFLDILDWFNTADGRSAMRRYGGASPQTLTVLLRKVHRLKREGASMFDAPGFNVDTLLQTDEEGKGVVTILDLTDMQERPGLFASAMMWLLYEVYRRSPEVGDVVKPRLVFFFDEAHLLFKDASKGLVDTVERTVRMSRSKGLGVFFVTQTATDLPEEILGQLGNRVQHALRAFTPKDAKAVRDTVKTFPHSAAYDVHHAIQGMSTGQAIISVLTADGAPGDTVVAKVNLPKALEAKAVKSA